MTGKPPPTPAQRLAQEPECFDLDQGIDVAAHGAGPHELRLRSRAQLAHASAPIVQADPEARSLTLASFGLIGPGGVLPLHHTALVAAEHRRRAPGLHDFLDLLSGRFAALWARAGAKYRPTRDPAPAERVLAASIGVLPPPLAARTGLPLAALLYHAGHLASRSRSAERLRSMLEAELGCPVDIIEFAGCWLRLPEQACTRLGGGGGEARNTGQHAQLGSALAGSQVWDASGRFILRIGPLPHDRFDALLPGRALHARITALTRLFVGQDVQFAINPVLARDAIPPLTLRESGFRLGWTTWCTQPGPRARDGAEPVFAA
jgi:type VI secretion system protein ImpH